MVKTSIAAATISSVAIALTLSSCKPHPSEASLPQTGQPIPEVAQAIAQQPHQSAPATVGIFPDLSGSMTSARVAPVKFEDFQVVFDALQQTGGTIAFGAICDRSNQPLVRATLPQPPRLEASQFNNPIKPEEPNSKRGNPFKNKKIKAEYDQLLQIYEQQLAQDRQTLANFQQRLATLKKENQAQIATIKPQVVAILNHPRNCQATDIQTAIQRANLLFQEPSSGFNQPPRRFAVFITDGLDTFSSQAARLSADKVLLVNGTPGVGIFQTVPHSRFESPQIAVNHLSKAIGQP
ncbi:hypothetical protein [Kamptonema sp. UHCC 0994]|uniref:hypothetical protein n=1 Tax=Kamptonema sp. UHCC 0994 TaxID=3031329 RepID=UPI0023B9971B|nr:hypothetical protein [Kamptonema sp. UHCC 0994]MDF0555620.1 hypothetical protein [Kamptonema sp. UHCC 0994]